MISDTLCHAVCPECLREYGRAKGPNGRVSHLCLPCLTQYVKRMLLVRAGKVIDEDVAEERARNIVTTWPFEE